MVLVFATAAADAANSEDLRFPVDNYAVQGASVFTPQQIGALLAPYTGPAISFSDIEAVRAALQAAYLRAGWGAALVTIPEQEVAGASIRLQVLEPRLKSIDLSGNQRFDRANVLASLPALRLGSMPNTAELAGQVALANENPAKQTEVVFRSAGEPGQIEAAVQVAEDRLWRRFVSLDNSGTEETGEYRLAAGAQYANLWNRDHVVTLQYTTSPSAPARVHIFGAGYRIPLYATGDSVELVAGYSSVDSGTVQG
ncbi:MAG: ShlB/FhaC/HecB family hemolysin secretion/activation protein, partial [Rhodocyclaceae bacterium]|nr:ShlB/FhaC/HecB family hemolysin secretion/activation protein [Rhodocyclaceae bacterium]